MTLNGNQYANWVAKYIKTNFSSRNIVIYREVSAGKSIIGKNRRIDILVLDKLNDKAVAIECKYQGVSGTADEKVPYTLQDCEAMQMDCYVVYGGDGFSNGISHMLASSELACQATPINGNENDFSRSQSTKELDHVLAMRFNWWDILVEGKNPI